MRGHNIQMFMYDVLFIVLYEQGREYCMRLGREESNFQEMQGRWGGGGGGGGVQPPLFENIFVYLRYKLLPSKWLDPKKIHPF